MPKLKSEKNSQQINIHFTRSKLFLILVMKTLIPLQHPTTATVNPCSISWSKSSRSNLNSINLYHLHHYPQFRIPRLSISNSTATPDSSSSLQSPIVVVGSANADIYVEIDRLPKEGETIAAVTGQTLAGGKGANQACCAARLSSSPTYFVGQIGNDANGKLIEESLQGVRLDCLCRVDDAPTGHAVVMLQPNTGVNSIIIVGGANMSCWPSSLRDSQLHLLSKAGILLLQREIPDRINLLAAKAAKESGVPVILDVGGIEAPIPEELMKSVDILSPNETELARLTAMPTDSFDDIVQAVVKCHQRGVKQVLVKMGEKGSVLFIEGEEPIIQPIVPAPQVVDTTGAGDTFTAAFAVALVEGMPKAQCMHFAAAAASLCVQVKGAIPSMPTRNAVEELLHSLKT